MQHTAVLVPEILLVQEKGYNTYNKRPDADCTVAVQWWEDNKEMWTEVRDVWDDIYAKSNRLQMEIKVDDKRLYEHLFFGEKEWDRKTLTALFESYINKNVADSKSDD